MATAAAVTQCDDGRRDDFARQHLPPPEQWPDLIFTLPELNYPARLNCVAELLDHACAKGRGAHPALLTYRETWTYEDLQERVNRIAHVLVDDLGLLPGNRVLLRGTNTPMLAACFLAVIKAGGIAVPSMPLLRAKELGMIIDKAQVSHALCASDLAEEVALCAHPVLRQILYFNGAADDALALESRMVGKPATFSAYDSAADEVCLIGFTSGTTGKPKGTMHFHRDVLAICDCFPRSMLQSQPDDVFIGTPPLAFTFGLGGLLLFPLRVGATAVLLEKMSPESLLQAIADFKASICFTAPTFYRQMASLVTRFDLTSLRQTVSAGEALPAATRADWAAATGLVMIDGIGATEMLHIFISAAGAEARPGATGKPIPGYQACVLDEQGVLVPPGVVGRLAVKGPTGCRYLADERQAAYVLNGWNLTGDAYRYDVDGYFWYCARTDDMIISSGYNIAGPEVEAALLLHPAVAEAAVIGVADEQRGQRVKAYIVLRQGWVGDAGLCKTMQDFVKQAIAPYKYPREIEWVSSLPRTETGKLQRFKLRDHAL
ncbi:MULTISPECIES: AMP-binding protein [unclassified Undibacterium]|uniref:AMP-binding protein n=1 Tax=unclassified Undibacterium TaxID=2630295 RepID=UPI002AC9029D|nr:MULTISPECIES: AMP-binding protein [unclassified Undibacterium]MEB0138686.1 AMP-binding protein [Undibacterium sp. CCC2.1]MEB0171487.1 AMP-binding protein [Undibacterium sp. CCC1.1]MEB0175442.1 AMP-binding protein [Undibacterium sp. CCC3.4]MEB0214687.1 AMP-binding protein [Undibacterium sp. 5I2]WPX45687.1 AMP-binding protein [Undibacterium sp. CCC3.4]